MSFQSLIKAFCVASVCGKWHAHPLAVIAFNDAFDRKTAETLLLAVVVLIIVFIFVYTTKEQTDKPS